MAAGPIAERNQGKNDTLYSAQIVKGCETLEKVFGAFVTIVPHNY